MGVGTSILGDFRDRGWLRAFLGVAVLMGAMTGSRADSGAASFVVDLGHSDSAAYPLWLKSVPPDGPTIATTETDFAVTRPEGVEGDLLLTVIFDEKDGGFLRVYRKNQDQAQLVSDNLFEGTGAANQRTLLIPAIDAQTPTTLVFQSSSGTSAVRRLVWEWPQTRTVPVVRASTASILIRHDAILTGDEVSGQPLPSPQPGVQIDYTTTPLLNQAAQADGAMVFKAALDRLPAHVRLEGKVSGLPLTQQLECWVNGQRAGVFGLSLPSLRDPAYLLAPGSAPTLAAWRTGSLYLPGSLWSSGENQVEFRPVGADASSVATTAYALKDVVLELIYDDAPSATAASTPATPSTPTPAPAS